MFSYTTFDYNSKYPYKELIARDKTSLDIFWLKDKSLTDLDNLPEPDILAQEIIENIEAGLNSFREIVGSLGEVKSVGKNLDTGK